MIIANDILYDVFENKLHHYEIKEETTEFFTMKVIEEYLVKIAKSGLCVPSKFRKAFEEELKEEVTIMLRKKIYGHLSLGDYRSKISGQLSPKQRSN